MTQNQTTDRKLIELEFLRRAVSTLENAVYDAYWRGSASCERILEIVNECVGKWNGLHMEEECPQGSVKNDEGMCVFNNRGRLEIRKP